MVCDKWYNLAGTLPSNLDADLPRFGHTSVVVNGTMLIHGGFNGVLMNDTLIFSPGKCQIFKEKAECLEARAGVKCAWNSKKSVCEPHPPHRAKSGIETCLENKRSKNHTNTCEMIKSCTACTSTAFGCVWCKDECKWRGCGEPYKNRKARFNSGFSEDNAKELDDEIAHSVRFQIIFIIS